MTRTVSATLAGLLLFTTAARAAEGPAGSWRLTIPQSPLTFLIKLEEKDGKWSAQYLGATLQGLKKIVMGDTTVTQDAIRVAFKIPGEAEFHFDGKLPPDPKTGKIAGSLEIRGSQLVLTHLEPSKLKAFDKFDFGKETLEQSTDPAVLLDAALDLITQAAEKKAKPEDVRGWADKAFKPAEAYGARWQRTVTTRLAQALSTNKELAPVAIEYARKAERLLDADDDPNVQMETLETVAQVLTKAGKADDAKAVTAKIAKLEERDYAEYLKKAPFKPEPFEGRKSKSDRAVLVELFTGAALDPGVAAGSAFQALEKTYKPKEVILLQYHLLREAGPFEVLANPSGLERARYYSKQFKGIPSMFINGKAGPAVAGQIPAARTKYGEVREAINALLETPADAKLDMAATRKDNETTNKATSTAVAKTGDAVRLRFVLAEDRVRYAGGNGMRYHHFVARAIPGGIKGFAITKKSGEQTATVNLETVRTDLVKFYDEVTGGDPEAGRPDRLLTLGSVRVVALIQDDESNDVLQAAQVEVK